MPIYRHECECGNANDELYFVRQLDENASMKCPKCGEMTYNRVMSATNFDIIGYCYENSIHGKKGRYKANQEQYQKVLAGEASPY